MNFDYTDKVKGMQARLLAFMDEHIYPTSNVSTMKLPPTAPMATHGFPPKLWKSSNPKHAPQVCGICFCPTANVRPKV